MAGIEHCAQYTLSIKNRKIEMSDTHDTFHKKMVEDVTPKSMRQFACFCDSAPREQIRLYADALAAAIAQRDKAVDALKEIRRRTPSIYASKWECGK